MTERPILMNAAMVRAILDGRKTMTRRAAKEPGWATPHTLHPFNDMLWAEDPFKGDREVPCPYGQPGDLLWVRESFQPLMADGIPESEWQSCDYKTGKGYKISFPATDGIVEYYNIATDDAFCNRVTPSIYMPRWASRITLEVTGVRVERLNDINRDDAKAEGVEPSIYGRGMYVDQFRELWNKINGAGSWAANPWVWVVSFRRVEK